MQTDRSNDERVITPYVCARCRSEQTAWVNPCPHAPITPADFIAEAARESQAAYSGPRTVGPDGLGDLTEPQPEQVKDGIKFDRLVNHAPP